MARIWGSAALLGFGVTVAVHVATTVGRDLYVQFPLVWLLHLGAILVFGACVASAAVSQFKLADILSRFPVWALVLVGITFVYNAANVYWCLHIIGGGNAAMSGGQYVLTTHGRLLAHLTEAEYHAHRAAELRLFSGAWFPFYLMSAVYFLLSQGTRPLRASSMPPAAS